MPESLDEIKTTPEQEQPAGRAWGGARSGAGRKKKGKTARAATPPPAEDTPEEPLDPDVQEMLDGAMAQADEVFPLLAMAAISAVDPKGPPPSETEIKAMAVTAKPVAFKYLGGAAQYLGIEGVFALVWLSVLGRRWFAGGADANPPGSDRRPVGHGQNHAGAPAGGAGPLS